jgi:hypothetical protein
METRNVLSYLLLIVLAGCVPSLHPLYSDDTTIFEESLVGKWSEKDSDDIWEFRKAGEDKYMVRIGDDKGRQFEGHLVNLEGTLFLDLYPEELDLDDDFYEIHFVRAHTFLRVFQLDPNLQLAMMNPDIIGDDPNVLQYEETDDYKVLTASTQELQEFILKHADDPNAFDRDAAVMTRRTPLYSAEDIIFDERLIGTWEGEDGEILDSEKGVGTYKMFFANKDGDEHEFTAQLVQVKNLRLLCIFFDMPTSETDKHYSLHRIPDRFMIIDQIEPQLLIRDIDYEEASQITADPAVSQEDVFLSDNYWFKGIRINP